MGIKLTWNVSIGYKRKILLMLLTFLMLAASLFGIYYFYSYRNHIFTRATDNTMTSLNRVTDELNSRLEEINNYYIAYCSDEKVLYLLEHDMSTKDSSKLQEASEILNGNNIINDGIAEFTLVNFVTEKVLSSKGFYLQSEMTNEEEVLSFYSRKEETGRNYWYYTKEGTNSNLRNKYRLTVQTNGIDMVLMLPKNSIYIKGMLIVRLDENELFKRMRNRLMDDQDLVIVDEMGNVLYGTDKAFTAVCQKQTGNRIENAKLIKTANKGTYALSEAFNENLGWQIYIGTNYSLFSNAFNIYSMILVILMILAFFAMLLIFCRLIYEPVSKLTKLVNADFNENEDEIEFVASHIEEITTQNKQLEGEVKTRKMDALELTERKLLNGEVSADEIEGLRVQHGLFEKHFYYTATFLLHEADDQKMGETIQERAVFDKCCKELEKEFKSVLIWKPIYFRGALWVMFEENELEVLEHIVPDYYQKLQNLVGEISGKCIKAGISAVHGDALEFKDAIQESIRAISRDNDDMTTQDSSTCNFYTEFVHRGKSVYDRSFEKEIGTAIIGANKEQVYGVCDRFFEYLKNAELSRSERTAFVIQFVSFITLSFMEVGLDADNMYRIGTSEIYEKLFELYDMSKVRRFIKWNLIDSAWERLEEEQANQVDKVLSSIERYVEERNGNITLTECADELGIHPTYIWKVLKKERGKSFSEYQESYKLLEAKRLLIETDLSVNEIAAKLNYTNAQNFIRFFNKETGMTPGKFRKQQPVPGQI